MGEKSCSGAELLKARFTFWFFLQRRRWMSTGFELSAPLGWGRLDGLWRRKRRYRRPWTPRQPKDSTTHLIIFKSIISMSLTVVWFISIMILVDACKSRRLHPPILSNSIEMIMNYSDVLMLKVKGTNFIPTPNWRLFQLVSEWTTISNIEGGLLKEFQLKSNPSSVQNI